MSGERLVGVGLTLLGLAVGVLLGGALAPLARWMLSIVFVVIAAATLIAGHAKRGTIRR